MRTLGAVSSAYTSGGTSGVIYQHHYSNLFIFYLFFSPSPPPRTLLHIPLITVIFECMLIYTYTTRFQTCTQTHTRGVGLRGKRGLSMHGPHVRVQAPKFCATSLQITLPIKKQLKSV